ncbi:MATE family efflux transporter [Novosphingobium colocasiae]
MASVRRQRSASAITSAQRIAPRSAAPVRRRSSSACASACWPRRRCSPPPHAFLSAYIDVADPANARLVALATGFLFMAAVFQFSDGLQAVAAGALRGLQDTRVPMAIALAGYWLGGFATAYVLGFHTRLAGLGGMDWAGGRPYHRRRAAARALDRARAVQPLALTGTAAGTPRPAPRPGRKFFSTARA